MSQFQTAPEERYHSFVVYDRLALQVLLLCLANVEDVIGHQFAIEPHNAELSGRGSIGVADPKPTGRPRYIEELARRNAKS